LAGSSIPCSSYSSSLVASVCRPPRRPAWSICFLSELLVEIHEEIARSLRNHRELILNYFRAQKMLSSGVVEGLNNKAKVTMKKSYDFRAYRVLELALFPQSSHCNLPLEVTSRTGSFITTQRQRCCSLLVCTQERFQAAATESTSTIDGPEL
jgi:hypothetical protein